MPISTDKLVTLAQLRAQAERIKTELAKYQLVSELGSLAKKSEISEAELSAALKATIEGKLDKSEGMTATAIQEAIATAVSEAGHATFQKVDSVPTVDTAQQNVLYLVMNTDTGFYDIYALVSDEVVRLDDTSVDLSNYATLDDLNNVSVGGAVYEASKTDLSASDTSIIEAYFTGDGKPTPKKGDVFVINTVVDGKTYEQSAYSYDGTNWIAMTGNVDANKVIMREDVTLAGDYTQLGNWTKDQNGTAVKATKGMSFAAILKDITSKTLQPTITAQPSVGAFTLTGAGAVEAGTTVSPAQYSGATLNKGSYKYGPKSGTGVTASAWKVERITDAGTVEVANTEGETLAAGSDTNDGNGFIIGDAGGDNVVASLKYKATATHGAGVQAEDNLGGASNPAVAIAAGTKSKETAAYTPFRNYFHGATADKPTLDSAYIRGLTKSGKAYAAGVVTINVAAGTQRIAIACISDKTGVKKVINETAMNADVTDTFTKHTDIAVEGANGYTAKNYNVWVYEPAKPYENACVLKVTLG